jgi:hypothetical protein
MVGLTITGNQLLAVGFLGIKGTYVTQVDIDAGKVVNTFVQRKIRKNSISGTTVTDDTLDTPLTQTPRIALVKTAAVGGTGKVGDVITYAAVTKQGTLPLRDVIVDR